MLLIDYCMDKKNLLYFNKGDLKRWVFKVFFKT